VRVDLKAEVVLNANKQTTLRCTWSTSAAALRCAVYCAADRPDLVRDELRAEPARVDGPARLGRLQPHHADLVEVHTPGAHVAHTWRTRGAAYEVTRRTRGSEQEAHTAQRMRECGITAQRVRECGMHTAFRRRRSGAPPPKVLPGTAEYCRVLQAGGRGAHAPFAHKPLGSRSAGVPIRSQKPT
jgi:hypothetical protein